MKEFLRRLGLLRMANGGKTSSPPKKGRHTPQPRPINEVGRATSVQHRPKSTAGSAVRASRGSRPSAPPIRKRRTIRRLESFESLPAHHGLAFGSDGRPFVNNRELRQDYAVLFEDERQTRVMLISSLDVGRGVAAVDTNLLTIKDRITTCLLYTSPSPRDKRQSRMPSSA